MYCVNLINRGVKNNKWGQAFHACRIKTELIIHSLNFINRGVEMPGTTQLKIDDETAVYHVMSDVSLL